MAMDFHSDELGEFDEFELPAFAASSDILRLQPAGVCCGLLMACVAGVVFLSACVWSPPAWLQPTVVGMLWASLFLIGTAAGSVRRGSALFACVAGSYVWLSQIAMQSLTSLVAAECGLLVVCTFAAGWLVTQFEFSGRSPQTLATQVRRYQQWTIWDLALLTTLVAVICYGLPRLESPLILLSQVGFVLLGGCICSCAAYRWVFDDCWTTSKLIVMFVGSGLCFWLLCFWLLGRQTPTEFSLLHIATWMLTGPIAVVAAQGLTVLVLLTAIRVDQGSLSKNKRLAEQVSASYENVGDSHLGETRLRVFRT